MQPVKQAAIQWGDLGFGISQENIKYQAESAFDG